MPSPPQCPVCRSTAQPLQAGSALICKQKGETPLALRPPDELQGVWRESALSLTCPSPPGPRILPLVTTPKSDFNPKVTDQRYPVTSWHYEAKNNHKGPDFYLFSSAGTLDTLDGLSNGLQNKMMHPSTTNKNSKTHKNGQIWKGKPKTTVELLWRGQCLCPRWNLEHGTRFCLER